MPDADLSATLAGIKERFETATEIPLETLPLKPEQAAAFAALVMDIPSLVAAVQAALKLADDWDKTSATLDARAERALASQTRVLLSGRAQAHQDCAQALREAITRELPREETGDGR